jgi:hypothetical protein
LDEENRIVVAETHQLVYVGDGFVVEASYSLPRSDISMTDMPEPL